MPTFNGRNIIAMPVYPPAPASIEWEAIDVVGTSVSPFTGQMQIQNWQNAWLQGRAEMPAMPNPYAQQWIAWLAALQGPANVFQFGDPRFTAPQAGPGSGAMVVNGSNQSGFLLSVRGFTGTLTMGDFLQIGYRLYRVVQTQVLTGGGAATLQIWPNLRESPADGTAISLTNTQGLFCLKDGRRPYSQALNRTYGISFDFREAL